MDKKLSGTLAGSGALNIVLGVIAIATGVTSGTLLLISGGKLLHQRGKL